MTNLISARRGPSEGEGGHGGTVPLALRVGFDDAKRGPVRAFDVVMWALTSLSLLT